MKQNTRELFVLQGKIYYPADSKLRLGNGSECKMSEESPLNIPVRKRTTEFDVKYGRGINFCWFSCNQSDCPAYNRYRED